MVAGDELRALNMLDCAISKLDQYNGNLPSEVKTALMNHYGGTSSKYVAKFLK